MFLCTHVCTFLDLCVMQIGGSADLTTSNETRLKGETAFSPNPKFGSYADRYIHFGVREHGMAAICNGLYAYGCFRPFGATFLNFITYAWGAVRLAALSKLGCLFISTHDSIELGEDGPTHQAVEVIPLCRALPNMLCARPAGNSGRICGCAWFVFGLRTDACMPIMIVTVLETTHCIFWRYGEECRILSFNAKQLVFVVDD